MPKLARQLRIMMIVNVGFEIGGAEKSVRLMRDSLRANGHEVFVVSTDAKLGSREYFSDLLVPQRPSSGVKAFIARIWYQQAYEILSKAIGDFEPDLIHLHTVSEFGPAALKATASVPTLLTVHGPEDYTKRLIPWALPPESYRHRTYRWGDLTPVGCLRYLYLRYLQRPLYRRQFRHVDAFIAPSQYMASVLQDDAGRTPVLKINNGTEIEQAHPLPGTQEVLFAGRLEAVKGVDVLLHAMAQATKQLPGLTLTVAGDGDDRRRLESLTESLGLRENVRFLGRLDAVQMAECRRRAQAIVIPSVWPENFPTVALEALAAGRPIIGSAIGGIPELVLDGVTGRLVAPGDVGALSSALIEVIGDPERAQRMHVWCQEHAAHFSIEPFIRNVTSVYERAISKK